MRRLPRLDSRLGFVDGQGRPTLQSQRWWQDFAEKIEQVIDDNAAVDALQQAALDALDDALSRANACYDVLGPGAYSFTASTTLPGDCRTAIVDTTGGAVTLTLLPVANCISDIVVKKTNAGANNVVVAAAGAETIDGAASVTFNAQYASRTLRPASGAWHVMASYL